jgi:hypothetical protein
VTPSDALPSGPARPTQPHLGTIEAGTLSGADLLRAATRLRKPTGYPEGTEVYAVEYRYDGQTYSTRVIVGPNLSAHPTGFEDIRKIISVRLTGSNRPNDVAAITVESLVLL